MEPTLLFVPNDAGETEGLSEPGIETFRDNPFMGTARETGQNSLDARRGEDPVEMRFERLAVPTTTFPAIDEFRDAAKRCLAIAEQTSDEREIEFFTQAMRVLTEPELFILRIADFQTRGLEGPCIDGRPFHALVKSMGISSKDSVTAGGSFGIGKSALYAASDLQTAFYSTIYLEDDNKKKFLCQGKTRFRSFLDKNHAKRRSVGYWGVTDGFLPVTNADLVPEWLRRSEVGTTVCAIAMRQSTDWHNEIVASLIQNFFCAIHEGTIRFDVGGTKITANTLLKHFQDDRVRAIAVECGHEDGFDFSRTMYECLTSEDSQIKTISVRDAGDFRVRILVRDGLPKRIGIIRNGMFICDNLDQFGHRFQRFPLYRDFVAIVEPISDSENRWLRRMENPRHDNLSPERITDPTKRQIARRAGTALGEAIRDTIKSLAKTSADHQTDLEELSEFFALENVGDESNDGPRSPSTFKIFKRSTFRKPRMTEPPSEGLGEQGGSIHGSGSGDGSNGYGSGSGTGRGLAGTGSRQVIQLTDLRTLLSDPKDYRKRKIYFTPLTDGDATLEFQSSGVNSPDSLILVDGPALVQCKAGVRQSISVTFLTPYTGPIEVRSWSPRDDTDEA